MGVGEGGGEGGGGGGGRGGKKKDAATAVCHSRSHLWHASGSFLTARQHGTGWREMFATRRD